MGELLQSCRQVDANPHQQAKEKNNQKLSLCMSGSAMKEANTNVLVSWDLRSMSQRLVLQGNRTTIIL